MLDDLVDIVCSDEETKKMLIFRNQKFAVDVLYQKVVMELNKRIKGYENHFLLKLLSLKLETNSKAHFRVQGTKFDSKNSHRFKSL